MPMTKLGDRRGFDPRLALGIKTLAHRQFLPSPLISKTFARATAERKALLIS